MYDKACVVLDAWSPTFVWRSVCGGRFAAPVAPPPRPAASWPRGCHSAPAGSLEYWWYSIAQLRAKALQRKKSRS